ncbi:MAG: hypothetical protein EBZ48_06330 [Proteobacteria bacterium]|nr:hypothetical protein [Pseudomonadota bacterium]
MLTTLKRYRDAKKTRPVLRLRIWVTLAAVVIGGCSARQEELPSRYSEVIGGGHQKVEERRVSKAKFLATLKQGEGSNEVRLVSVFRREGQRLPQYRIFDVRPGSAYQLLGLEDGDLLLAADDRIVYDPAGFRTFVVEYLKGQSSATITISRGGVTSLYRYSFAE